MPSQLPQKQNTQKTENAWRAMQGSGILEFFNMLKPSGMGCKQKMKNEKAKRFSFEKCREQIKNAHRG
ncbi:MAG: hypothetical protein D3910_28175 [Candidatus Electrothrix sp. ATG2]|nr:hypothetical protein [Candidatus Electrothrix sp. ATG2]